MEKLRVGKRINISIYKVMKSIAEANLWMQTKIFLIISLFLKDRR